MQIRVVGSRGEKEGKKGGGPSNRKATDRFLFLSGGDLQKTLFS